jgi:hypothetical protein
MVGAALAAPRSPLTRILATREEDPGGLDLELLRMQPRWHVSAPRAMPRMRDSAVSELRYDQGSQEVDS